MGLAQIMPATGREMAGFIRRAGGPDYTLNFDLNNPEINLHLGTFYLNRLMGLFGNNLQLSLMAYNGGMGRVRTWIAGNTLPIDLFTETVPILETRDYGRIVIAGAAIYDYLYYRQAR